MGLLLTGKLLKLADLPARDNFPPSSLLTVLDDASGETMNLIADKPAVTGLTGVPQFADVELVLRWRLLDLAALGGSGRGKAYRLMVADGRPSQAQRTPSNE